MTRQQELDHGLVAARNLAEALSINFTTLLCHVAPHATTPVWDKGITRKMQQAAVAIAAAGSPGADVLRASPSDTVRSFAAYLLMANPDTPLAQRLEQIRPFADDLHFAVREWAWMAIRPHLAADLETSIPLLTPWTAESSPRLRRFAVESLRPRGVWCAHIAALKTNPILGLPLLDPLKCDPEKYVQDSVANWLNDAAKTKPAWVSEVCERWLAESQTKPTLRITTRARRSIR